MKGSEIHWADSRQYSERSNAAQSDSGAYAVAVTNAFGTNTSSNAVFWMYPYITTPFVGAVAYWDKDASFGMEAWGTASLSY